MEIFLQQLQRLLSQKRETFSGFFIAFLKFAWNLEHFEKKDECPSLIFSVKYFPKEVATETSRRSFFRTPFGNQRVNGFQTTLKDARHYYYNFLPWIPGKLSWKKTALLWSKILRLFANTLTADDKYSCRKMENFPQQLQMLLSQKRKTFSGFFIAFLKCSWNLEHFEKRDECRRRIISEIIVSEGGCYWKV